MLLIIVLLIITVMPLRCVYRALTVTVLGYPQIFFEGNSLKLIPVFSLQSLCCLFLCDNPILLQMVAGRRLQLYNLYLSKIVYVEEKKIPKKQKNLHIQCHKFMR